MITRVHIPTPGRSLAELHVRWTDGEPPEHYTVRRDHDTGDETDDQCGAGVFNWPSLVSADEADGLLEHLQGGRSGIARLT